jgi:hypothetical protein
MLFLAAVHKRDVRVSALDKSYLNLSR